jgi:transposase
VRVSRLLRSLAGLCRATVVTGWSLDQSGDRPELVISVRVRDDSARCCGRCGQRAAGYDQGGGLRRWRHVDVGIARCVLEGPAPRVGCGQCGPTVAMVPWARHDTTFTQAFEDVVVWDAVRSNKNAAGERHQVSWRAVNGICERVLAEAMGRVDLLAGLTAIAIDEVKSKKGQRYLTVVSDHFGGRVVWVAEGRSKAVVGRFFDALGTERAAELEIVTADGAEWIRTVVAGRAPNAEICLDTFHVISWATKAVDEVRRQLWRHLGGGAKAKAVKGMRFLLIRNWANLTRDQKRAIRDLETDNRRLFRAWQLKEELIDIFSMSIIAARRALDDWLHYASRSRLPPFVKLARTIRRYRDSIEATIEWGFTNGIAEANNSVIGRIRRNATGFHNPKAFITMILLDRGGLAPKLPWTKS